MLTITCQLQLPQLVPRYLSRSCCRDSPCTCGLQTANSASSKHMGQKWPYLNFLDDKITFYKVNHWTLAKKLLDRNVPLLILKLFIYWNREQEFMVRWGNSLSMTFHYSNWIRQGGKSSPLLYNVYTDDLNHHLRATGTGCYVAGIWVNSLSYADDVVLLAPRVTALQTLLKACRTYSGLHDIAYNTTETVCMLVDQSNHRLGTQQESGSEMRNLALSRSFVT